MVVLIMLIGAGLVYWAVGQLYARYWKRAASKVLFQYALACHKKEDRDVLARRAVMAGKPSCTAVVCP